MSICFESQKGKASKERESYGNVPEQEIILGVIVDGNNARNMTI